MATPDTSVDAEPETHDGPTSCCHSHRASGRRWGDCRDLSRPVERLAVDRARAATKAGCMADQLLLAERRRCRTAYCGILGRQPNRRKHLRDALSGGARVRAD